MESKNKRYYVEFEVLTPLSVGAGNENDWIRGIDYVVKNRKVYVLDMEKISQIGVDVNRLATAFATSNEGQVLALLGSNLERASARIFDLPVDTTNSIKAFIRTQLIDLPVVPGSSIKGAIRSCLFNDFHGPQTDADKKLDSKTLNEQVFGTMKVGDVFTRFIHVGDVIMPSTQLVNSKIFNLQKVYDDWEGGWKFKKSRPGTRSTSDNYSPNGFNTIYECVTPGAKGIGTIDMMRDAYDLLCKNVSRQRYYDKKKSLMESGINELFSIINTTTWNYLQKELEFFEKYKTDRVDEIINSINAIMNKIPEDDCGYCIMKMSAGAGFHSITGDWQYDDYYDAPGFRGYEKIHRYKSRKIVEFNRRLQLMGLVLIRKIDHNGQERYCEYVEQMKK